MFGEELKEGVDARTQPWRLRISRRRNGRRYGLDQRLGVMFEQSPI
jgi:hypothetical protein